MKYFDPFIKTALEEFYKNDQHLIEHDAHEQSMSARIAHYLIGIIEGKHGFENIHIDCEYNKNIYDPKRAGGREKYSDRPDIIAHERNSKENNRFVIEMKKNEYECDKCKIKKLVNDPELRYEEGYAIQEIKEDSFHLFFYKRGAAEGAELDFRVSASGGIEPLPSSSVGT